MQDRRSIVPIECWIGLALIAITAVIYGQTARHEFISFDDNEYITDNAQAQAGLTAETVAWAFRAVEPANWHPVTWLSHLLDVELFGLWAGGHHFTSVFFHALNSVLVFVLLRYATGALWRSAMVAALFAVHPMHVESVAWISERKDVLSTFFALLALIAYVGYVKQNRRFLGLLALVLFAVGLMAKSMLVTLPCVMLLLDYWPLRRVAPGPGSLRAWRILVVEKAPFFALSGVFSGIAFATQRLSGAMEAANVSPLGWRAMNALASYGVYLKQTFVPTGLAVFYPKAPIGDLWLPSLAGAAALAAITAVVWVGRKRRPYGLAGWLWFVGMLAPVIGVVQVGAQAHADRYVYLPHVGLFVAGVWGVAGLVAIGSRYRAAAIGLGAVVLAVLSAAAAAQTSRWQTSLTLFEHTLGVTSNNARAHDHYGIALMEADRLEEAIDHFDEAVRLQPQFYFPLYNRGLAQRRSGNRAQAKANFQGVLILRPNHVGSHVGLGEIYLNEANYEQAEIHFRQALISNPSDVNVRVNFAIALAELGEATRAGEEFLEAIRRDGHNRDAHYNYALFCLREGDLELSTRHLRETLAIRENDADAHDRLADVLGRQGLEAQAREHGKRAEAIRAGAAEVAKNATRKSQR